MGYSPEQAIMLVNATSRAIAENQAPPEVMWKKILAGVAATVIAAIIIRGILKK